MPVAKDTTAKAPTKPGPKPGPKSGAKAKAATAPDKAPAATKAPEKTLAEIEAQEMSRMSELQRIRVELIAYSLIYDIFTLHTALAALALEDAAGENYFAGFYCARLSTILTDDAVEGNIGGLMDLGAWMAVRNNAVAVKVQNHFTRLLKPTDEQLRKLLIEASHCQSNRDRPSRGDSWMGGDNSGRGRARRNQSHHVRVVDDPTV